MLYHAIGSALVTDDELYSPSTLNRLSAFYADLAAGQPPGELALSTGRLTADNAVRALDPGAAPIDEAVAFQRIGPGLPLTIMIREVYTGQFPAGGLFGPSKKDLLVTSAVKSIATYDAKPRALNFLSQAVSAGSRLKRPPASKQGTPLVFYSPALLERSLTLDLTLVFDQFPEELFNTLGNTFTAAAGIPIFLAHSLYLLAAGAIAKIVGQAGEALFDGKPSYNTSEPLDIYFPGSPPLPAGYLLVTDGNVDRLDPTFRDIYQVDAQSGQVVDAKGKLYDGPIPYVVVSVDGTPQEEFAAFTPVAASAAVLSRFYGVEDTGAQLLGSLLDAVKVYNDYTFRQEIDRLDKQIAATPDGKDKDALKQQREALTKNILTDELKPQPL